MKKKRIVAMLIALVFVMINVVPVSAASRRATYYRGSWLMWTRDNVDFTYRNGKVTSSSGFQQCGWVFPNISRNNGIAKYQISNSLHRWRAVNTIGAGVVTPWGDVNVYSSTYVHRLNVYGSGAWNAYSD